MHQHTESQTLVFYYGVMAISEVVMEAVLSSLGQGHIPNPLALAWVASPLEIDGSNIVFLIRRRQRCSPVRRSQTEYLSHYVFRKVNEIYVVQCTK